MTQVNINWMKPISELNKTMNWFLIIILVWPQARVALNKFSIFYVSILVKGKMSKILFQRTWFDKYRHELPFLSSG